MIQPRGHRQYEESPPQQEAEEPASSVPSEKAKSTPGWTVTEERELRKVAGSMVWYGLSEHKEDIVQDALIILFRHLDDGKEIDTRGAYIRGIVSKLCPRYKDKNPQHSSIDDEGVQQIRCEKRENNPEECAIQRATDIEIAAIINQVLAEYPQKEAEIMRCSLLSDMTNSEIAAKFDVNEGTIKSRKSRLCAKLRALVQSLLMLLLS